ncbi:probable E3 ubiquitin-protein ligase makorin-1 [Musca vetustissima]|uniref:probable E3 ubiquitin-protein ligase makorin-1 n=1 Tax=Musca vetustissima TaxID=27455 RepID=UPI002AB79AC5|nr:probable E3 ubiquitin-protein ligase makorin-1 [Musca vetustissima]
MSTATLNVATSTNLLQQQQPSTSTEDEASSSSSAAVTAGKSRGPEFGDDVASTSTSHLLPTSPAICRYFQKGICRFGSVCRFSHDVPVGGEVISQSNGTNNSFTSTTTTTPFNSERPSTSRRNWANAPAFIPAADQAGGEVLSDSNVVDPNHSWADVVFGPTVHARTRLPPHMASGGFHEIASIDEECPYESPCPYGMFCMYAIHMELCEMCDQFCLHPSDEDQRKKHKKECLQQHEQAMELSFAIARSKDKTCGICFDTIMEKAGREKRFGILPNCNHIFCLECIRKWRQAKQFEHKITRSCPECRVSSDFVCPSAFWVETKEEKDKLLGDYRKALGIKDCKYFKKGDGKCPFGNKCFYKHALPNGELVDVGCPKKARKIHRSNNEIINLLDIYLYEFLEQRNLNFLDFFESTGDEGEDSSDDED